MSLRRDAAFIHFVAVPGNSELKIPLVCGQAEWALSGEREPSDCVGHNQALR